MKKKITKVLSAFAIIMSICSFIGGSETVYAAPAGSNVVYNKGAKPSMSLSWGAFGSSGSYTIARAGSRLGTYTVIGTSNATSFTDNAPNANKYENYYRISRATGDTPITLSLENQLFGDNMYFYDAKYETASTASAEINAHFVNTGSGGSNGEWTTKRQAYYFKPGSYDPGGTGFANDSSSNAIRLGFYSHIGGLGRLPNAVKLGSLDVVPHLSGGNATCTFWRSVENVTFQRDFIWSVSQSTSARRLQIESTSNMIARRGTTPWGSGGYIADTNYTGIDSVNAPQFRSQNTGMTFTANQQQWYNRNNSYVSTAQPMGGDYNMVYQGCINAGTNVVRTNGTKSIVDTKTIREKPFLFLDNDGEYKVFVPGFTSGRKGISWNTANNDMGVGEIQDLLAGWYVAKEGDTDVTINAALKAGKNIFFTPGHYTLDAPIQVNRTDAILLGAGIASVTLKPSSANTWGCVFVDDKSGIIIAGLLIDNYYTTIYQIRIGSEGANKDHSNNPIVLNDITCRVGGYTTTPNKTDVSMQINSNNVIGDHFWLWRADHGSGVGWASNVAKNGLIVKGNDVTLYAMFVEHYAEYEALFLGERTNLFFFQNEPPYDPPATGLWMSQGGRVDGWASYKVANHVNEHYAIGLGSYAVFSRTTSNQANAFEAPHKPGVSLNNMCTTRFAGTPHILNIVNGSGGPTTSAKVVRSFINGVATLSNDTKQDGIAPYDEVHVLPNNVSWPSYIQMENLSNR